jgi:hypothetical protein
MNNLEEEEEKTPRQIAIDDALEDAELKGFKEGCSYENIDGDTYIADYDPRVYRVIGQDCVLLECGEGHGLIFGKGKWGKVIKPIKKEE